ncbi:MAG: FHA domain-containing protein [Clostridia bacterium]|nr:FHA domain-containing protein [Clostridia bacterium]
MAKVECAYGHIYDADLYPSCPYCKGGNSVDLGGETLGPEEYGSGTLNDDVGVTTPIGATQGPRSTADDNLTKPPFGYDQKKVDEDEERTRPINIINDIEDGKEDDVTPPKVPVAGWLVAINGKNKGKDYPIYTYRNTIGRGKENDVVIEGDMSISREACAKIAYDRKHNKYHFIPGDTKNDIYLNDDPLYESHEIKAYDRVEIGETKLVFVPLCTDRFSWQDVESENKE